MKLLLVTQLDAYARAVKTVVKYVEVGQALGHEVAVLGEQRSEKPLVPCSLDVSRFDYAVFIVYETTDFPELPYLAHLLDGMPKDRRVVIDCCGRFNETIRVEHDFNHLEKLDGHQGWEWIEGLQAVSHRILQPTARPRRSDVQPFLFHGFDAVAAQSTPGSASEAAAAWSGNGSGMRPYGAVYVGNNWQRWTQIKPLIERLGPLREEVGPICLAGWGWDARPDWAEELGLRGVDVDPKLLAENEVETRFGIPFDEIDALASQAKFSPVVHRPLFNDLGLVTNRTFETLAFDTMPLLLLSEDFVASTYGPDAELLAVRGDVAAHVRDAIERPEPYWDALLKTRAYLARHHSYERRLHELEAILAE